MTDKKLNNYKKNIYWVSEKEAMNIDESLALKGIKVRYPKTIVCKGMDIRYEVSITSPDVWNAFCNRQGSWYRASEKKGLYLIISSFEIPELKNKKAAIITLADFQPPRFAEIDKKLALINNRELIDKMPSGWKKIAEKEKEIFLKWAKNFGSDVIDFEFLYLSHTANHANFINPRSVIHKDGQAIPYSIDRTAHLCSACLEFFQIIGEKHPQKLVAPCPGACAFAKLKPDRYYLVEKA